MIYVLGLSCSSYVCDSLLDESPRWLVSRGRPKEAVKLLKHISNVNKGSGGHLPEGAHFDEEKARREVLRCRVSSITRHPMASSLTQQYTLVSTP